MEDFKRDRGINQGFLSPKILDITGFIAANSRNLVISYSFMPNSSPKVNNA